jgi:hypothetical protein
LRRPKLRREPTGAGRPAPGVPAPANRDAGGSAPRDLGPLASARQSAATRQRHAERRGTIAALAVAAAIGVLLVVLQPRPKPVREVVAVPPPSTAVPTTALPAGFQLCVLAQQFVKDAEGKSPNDAARIAETFYAKAVKLVDPDLQPDFDSLLRYYTEFNAIGTEFDYDLQRIAKAGRGDRWAQLLYRAPAGVEVAERTLAERCKVALPAPPTVITEPPTTFTVPPRPSAPGP